MSQDDKPKQEATGKLVYDLLQLIVVCATVVAVTYILWG